LMVHTISKLAGAEFPKDYDKLIQSIVPVKRQSTYQKLIEETRNIINGGHHPQAQLELINYSKEKSLIFPQDAGSHMLVISLPIGKTCWASYYLSNGQLVAVFSDGERSNIFILETWGFFYSEGRDGRNERIQPILTHPDCQSFFDRTQTSNLQGCNIREQLNSAASGVNLPDEWIVSSVDWAIFGPSDIFAKGVLVGNGAGPWVFLGLLNDLLISKKLD
jgi:hypothetical protein